MATYVKEYSDVLVEELIVKDEQLREKELKNSFISSLLTLQSKLRDVQSSLGKKKNVPSANIVSTVPLLLQEHSQCKKLHYNFFKFFLVVTVHFRYCSAHKMTKCR